MTSLDTFGAKSQLDVNDESYEIFRIDKVEGHERLPYSLKVLLENLLRTEDGANITDDHIRALGGWDADAEPSVEIQFTPARVLMQDFTGVPCVVDLATMREAVQELGGRRDEGQPARPGGAGHRPLGHRRPVRPRGRVRPQRRAGVRAQPGAVPVPALGADGVQRVQGRAARHRHRAPGQHRIPGPYGDGARRSGVPRHGRGHRLAHHDGQRPGRSGLGRRRHRGRGGHARPAGEHAHPAGRRVQALRRDAGRHHRDRPRPHDHREAAQARRGRQVRRVLRPGRRRGAAGQPGHDRQHEPGVRLDRRDLPDRRRDDQVPPADRPLRAAGRARRGVRQGAGHVARPGRPNRPTRSAWSSTSPRSSRRWPARSARRTGCRSAGPSRCSGRS